MTEEQTYTSVYPGVLEVVSRPQDNIVLTFGNSNSDSTEAMAFRVERAIRRIERVTNGPTISDDDTLDFGYFGESGHSADVSSPGDEQFEIESERDQTIVEYGFGIETDGVYVAVETGDGDAVNGLSIGSNKDRGFGADDLQEFGGVLSDYTTADSPEAMPTTALSEKHDQGMVRIDSRQNGTNPFNFAFLNKSGGQVTVNPVAVGQTYEVRPIYDRETAVNMLAGTGHTRRVLTYGGFENTKPNLPRAWQRASFSVDWGEVGPAHNPPA